MNVSSKLKDAKKEALFSEIAILSKNKALLENRLMDLYYKELNLSSAPDKFDFFPSNKPSRQVVSFRPDMDEDQLEGINLGRGERMIGNVIVCFPKGECQNKPENKTVLTEIKYKKMFLLKKLNLLMQKISTLERQYTSLERQDLPQLFF